jgi:hypothetical protein
MYGMPPALVVTTGSPALNASMMECGMLSSRELLTKTSARSNQVADLVMLHAAVKLDTLDSVTLPSP